MVTFSTFSKKMDDFVPCSSESNSHRCKKSQKIILSFLSMVPERASDSSSSAMQRDERRRLKSRMLHSNVGRWDRKQARCNYESSRCDPSLNC